jgi:hypothetical protein
LANDEEQYLIIHLSGSLRGGRFDRLYEGPVLDTRVDRLDFSHVLSAGEDAAPTRHDDVDPNPFRGGVMKMAAKISCAKNEISVLIDLLRLMLRKPESQKSASLVPLTVEGSSQAILMKALSRPPSSFTGASEDGFAARYKDALLALLFRQSQLVQLAQRCRHDNSLIRGSLARQHAKFDFLINALRCHPGRERLLYGDMALIDFLFSHVGSSGDPSLSMPRHCLVRLLECREKQALDVLIYQLLLSEVSLKATLSYISKESLQFKLLENGFLLEDAGESGAFGSISFTLKEAPCKLSTPLKETDTVLLDELVVEASPRAVAMDKLSLALRYLYHRRNRLVFQTHHGRDSALSKRPLLIEFLLFFRANKDILWSVLHGHPE